jgi:hypothetical protein
MRKQESRISGHSDSVVRQAMQHQRRISVRMRRTQQPASQNYVIRGYNRNILQIRRHHGKRFFECGDLLLGHRAPPRM